MVIAGVIGARITWVLTHTRRARLAARRHRDLAGRPAVLRRLRRSRSSSAIPCTATGTASRGGTASTATPTASRIGLGDRPHRLLRGRRALRVADVASRSAVRYDGGSVREADARHRRRSSRGWCSTRRRSTSCSTWSCCSCCSPTSSTAASSGPGPGVGGGDLLRLLRRGPLRSDSLRVNDERILGLTGAQYLCLHPAPHQRVDLVPGAQAARPGHRGRDARRHRTADAELARRRALSGRKRSP